MVSGVEPPVVSEVESICSELAYPEQAKRVEGPALSEVEVSNLSVMGRWGFSEWLLPVDVVFV
jgi:hypothetical protein